MNVRVQRRFFARPHRDDIWTFIDALQAQIALQPDDNAHALASMLATAAILRGTRRGALLEIGFVVVQAAFTLVVACIPSLLRHAVLGCYICKEPLHNIYVVHWLLWAFVFSSGPVEPYICPVPDHNAPVRIFTSKGQP